MIIVAVIVFAAVLFDLFDQDKSGLIDDVRSMHSAQLGVLLVAMMTLLQSESP